MLSPVRVRSSRWVLEPFFMSPAWIFVLMFSVAVLWVLGGATVILALLVILLAWVLLFGVARWTRGKVL
jgi:hypothetical protein